MEFCLSYAFKLSKKLSSCSQWEQGRVSLRSQTRSRSHTRVPGFVIAETRSRSQMLRVPPPKLPNPFPNPLPTQVPGFRVYPCPGLASIIGQKVPCLYFVVPLISCPLHAYGQFERALSKYKHMRAGLQISRPLPGMCLSSGLSSSKYLLTKT